VSNGGDEEVLQRIDRFHATLERKTHFELLGVDEETPASVLRSQFIALGKQWHLDAFAGIELGDRKRKVDDIFQRINEAHETLKDPDARAEYMVLLDRRKQGLATDVHSVLRAEGLVDEALAKMRQRAWSEAKNLLEEARGLNPDDPLYRVYFAWATYQEKRSSRAVQDAAIKQLKDALSQQENLSTAHQYLGQIYFDREDYKSAIKWWRTCLRYDDKNIEATRGLRLANTRFEKQSKGGLGGLINKLFGK